MIRTFRFCLAFVLVACACNGSDKNTRQPGGGDGESTGDGDAVGDGDGDPWTALDDAGTEPSPDASVCSVGAACTCADGRIGKSVCEPYSCTCDACPSFQVSAAKSFTACGGAPDGAWELKSVDASGLGFRFVESLADVAYERGPCAAQLVSSDFSMRLQLLAGGKADYLFSDNLHFNVLESCINDMLVDKKIGCDVRGWDPSSCSNSGCGVCTCVDQRANVNGDPLGTWSSDGKTLSITVNPSHLSYDYCVQGDELMLKDDAALVLVMKRIHLTAPPAACNTRSPDTCEAGLGCHKGACAGPNNDCALAESEDVCLSLTDCAWDQSLCSGIAQASCALSDYGHIPGCEISR